MSKSGDSRAWLWSAPSAKGDHFFSLPIFFLDPLKKVTEWGRGAGPFTLKPAAYNFNIPHGLALAEDKNEVGVVWIHIGLNPLSSDMCC